MSNPNHKTKKLNKSRIGITLPTFNSEKYLHETLNSLRFQSDKNFVCYIFDNMSNDMTFEIINKFNDIDLIFLSKPDNSALDAINQGLKFIKEDYLLFLGSDDWLDINAIEILNKTLELNPDIPLIRFGVNFYKNDNINYIERSNVFGGDKLLFEDVLYGPTINYLIKKDLFNKHNYYNPRRWGACADREFLIRVAIHNPKIIELFDVLYHFRRHINSTTSSGKPIITKNILKLLMDMATDFKSHDIPKINKIKLNIWYSRCLIRYYFYFFKTSKFTYFLKIFIYEFIKNPFFFIIGLFFIKIPIKYHLSKNFNKHYSSIFYNDL